jgi:hypothetical protein
MLRLPSRTNDDLLAQGTCAVLIDDKVVGTAWLVTEQGHLLTAGHLLGKTTPREEVRIQFQGDKPRKAFSIHWGYSHQMGVDFAVLQLDETLANRSPLPVILADKVTGTFRLQGYGTTLLDCSSGTGQFLGNLDLQGTPGFRLFQIASTQTNETGYSGAGIFSDTAQAVVALQIEGTSSQVGAHRDTVLAMPLFRIAQVWKQLSDIASKKPEKRKRVEGRSVAKQNIIKARTIPKRQMPRMARELS